MAAHAKTTTPKELREMSDEQLALTLKLAQKGLFEIQLQTAADTQSSANDRRALRREIARIYTIRRQRELAAGA